MAMAVASRLHLPTRRSSTPPVVATTNDGVLPLDLLYDILLRLPTEAICRFRAVCRSWLSMLCHPDFIAAARNPGPLIAIGMCNTNEVNVLDLESGEAIKRVKVATNDLNNGFLSVGAISHDCLICVIDRDGQLYLLDLTSDVVSMLPGLTPRPQGSPYTFYNIGRAASTREHKLLAVSITASSGQQVCNILTLGDNGGWRDTGHPPLNVEWQTKGCAVINRVAYFLAGYRADSMEIEPHKQKIMAFDFKTEAWRPLAASLRGPAGKHRCICLAEMDGHLVAGCADRVASFEIELWFLVDSYMSYWSKSYTITMTSLQNHWQCSVNFDFLKPLAVLEDGRIVLWMEMAGVWTSTENNMMRIYDPQTKTFMDGARVSNCRSVGAFTWNLLHSGPRGAIDMAAKRLLINRCQHQYRASPTMEGPNKEL